MFVWKKEMMLLRQSQQSLSWRCQHRVSHRVTSAVCGSRYGTAAAPITARSISLYYDVPPRLQNNVSTTLQSKLKTTSDGAFVMRQILPRYIDCANNNFRQLRHLSSSTSHGGHNTRHEHRDRGDRRGRGPKLNEFGHDYTQIGGPINPSACRLNEVQINNLIRGRMQSRRIRNFNQADKIKEELTQSGVFIDDKAKVWRADGIKSSLMHATSTNNTKIPKMSDFNTFDEAIQTYYDNLDKLSPRNISSFWAAVPQILRRQNRGHLAPQLEAIFNKTAEQIGNYGPRDLATTALAFAKTIQILKGGRSSESNGNYHLFLHNTLVGKRDIIFQFIAKTAVPILSQFEPRYLANLAYTYALLGYVPKLEDGSALFDHIAEKSIPLLGKFTPQGLSNTVWSFEKLKQAHPALFEKVGDHISSLNHLNDFKPQDFTNIILAYSKAKLAHPDLFDKVGSHIAFLNNLDAFKPQELANTVWAFTKAGVQHPELFDKVGNHMSLNHLNDFIQITTTF